ncbi:MAG: hypothetical protein GY799_23685, partial [Desulfobulbaceae bacterium]|nr:hypothetical protein [Desulfobulbaceae bacterium]
MTRVLTLLRVLLIVSVASFILAATATAEARRKTSAIKLQSPNRKVVFEISAQDGKLTYAVKRSRAVVIEKSAMGIIIDDDTFGTKTTIEGSTKGKINERYPWRGVKSEVLNKCNTMIIKLDDDGRKWQVEARAYDDGIAFRYIIEGTGSRKVKGELTSWYLPVDTMAWCSDSTAHYEGKFTRQRVDQIVCKKSNKLCMPLTFELADGTYAAISEANVMGHSGMTVRPDGTYTLKAIFEDNLKGWNITDLIETPWRVVMTGPDLNALVNCDLIHNVCPPPDPELFPEGMNTEWVQAASGRSLWQWWAYLNPGTHWDRQKKFLDHAARLNCDFYLVDEGWEHPRQEWFEPGVTDSWPRLKELCQYGQSRGVGILVWRAWHANKNRWFPGLETEAKREDFFRKCAEVGVRGVKIDFMNSESHDRLEFYQDCLRKGAKYKIAINFHGANKPAGESRTWPNEVTREGIAGLEGNIIHRPCSLEMYSTLPFTRLLGGHGDFTPTTFQASRLKGTTPGMQMASPVLFTSSVQHWADKGEIYLNSPAVNMIRSMPTVWDETRVLS